MPKLRRCAVEFLATPARRAREVWSEEGGYKSVVIGHTVDKTSLNSLMVVTVEKIEKETNYWARRKWKEPHPQEEAVGYFIAKVDVWELEIEQLQKGCQPCGACWGGRFWPLSDILHLKLLCRFGPAGVGAAFGGHIRIFPPRSLCFFR